MLVTQSLSGRPIGLSAGLLGCGLDTEVLHTTVCGLNFALQDQVVISPCWAVLSRFIVSLNKAFRLLRSLKIQIQHYTVDYLAQGSMKNGANSEMPCELQDI